jgi:hypothetical protein
VVPGTAYDKAMPQFGGRIYPVGGLANAANPTVGLLWTDPFQKKPDLPMPANWLQQKLTRVAPADGTTPDTYSLGLFRPPPPEALVDVPSSDPKTGAPVVVRLAIAELVLYDDLDGDGRFQVTGPRADIVGADSFLGSSNYVLTYVESPRDHTSLGNTPLTASGRVGYQLVNYVCEGRISQQTAPVEDLTAVDLIVQPATSLPEVRNCRRTHSP